MSNATSPSTSRRSFLKASSFVAAATVVPASGAIAAQASPSSDATAFTPRDRVSLVNILQGTDSTPYFSRGNTLPIAALPFGMAHWTIQSRENSPWMFVPGTRRLQGFRSTHQLSPWLYDYGWATFLPVAGEFGIGASARASSYRPEDAKLSPHSLQLHLLRYGIDAELIPTERCAVIVSRYTDASKPGFLFDVPGENVEDVKADKASRTIRFLSKSNSGGVPDNFATYYVLRLSESWQDFAVEKTRDSHIGLVRFADSLRELTVQIGTSFLSHEQAALNLDREVGTHSPGDLREAGRKRWNEHLGRIEIEGGAEEELRTFYSCFYRTLLFPRIWHEPDAQGAMRHFSPFNGKAEPGVMYADHGYWDVYRAWYPMMSVLFPERLGEILQAWVNAYQEGGWLPQFPCPGYRACMTGSLIDSIFGEAAAKGIKGFDLAAAYEGLRKHATQPGDPDKGYGRRGIEEYLKYGYAPVGLVDQAAAETVDAAYGDYCIAQVAKAAGRQQDYEMFMKRSESWRHLFDPSTGFIRGKKADGSWQEPFDPVRWGDPYVEGAAWQHRWDVPHNIPALIEALGGKEKTVEALESMLAAPANFHVGSYGSEIHEMSEMAAVKFGQYAHSNQPVHHVLAIFTEAGRPDRAAYWSDRVMRELYSSQQFAGDEDTGSMSAWYVLGAIGILTLCPAKPEYKIGGALFPRVTVHLPGQKKLVVETSVGKRYSATFDGKPIPNGTIAHEDLVNGGTLRFIRA